MLPKSVRCSVQRMEIISLLRQRILVIPIPWTIIPHVIWTHSTIYMHTHFLSLTALRTFRFCLFPHSQLANALFKQSNPIPENIHPRIPCFLNTQAKGSFTSNPIRPLLVKYQSLFKQPLFRLWNWILDSWMHPLIVLRYSLRPSTAAIDILLPKMSFAELSLLSRLRELCSLSRLRVLSLLIKFQEDSRRLKFFSFSAKRLLLSPELNTKSKSLNHEGSYYYIDYLNIIFYLSLTPSYILYSQSCNRYLTILWAR